MADIIDMHVSCSRNSLILCWRYLALLMLAASQILMNQIYALICIDIVQARPEQQLPPVPPQLLQEGPAQLHQRHQLQASPPCLPCKLLTSGLVTVSSHIPSNPPSLNAMCTPYCISTVPHLSAPASVPRLPIDLTQLNHGSAKWFLIQSFIKGFMKGRLSQAAWHCAAAAHAVCRHRTECAKLYGQACLSSILSPWLHCFPKSCCQELS